ncbi:hypothetical protein GOV07_01335 [Candidatus Woesearchaeota archaeon]|nr:hypothetical protein [Candidatus Woesearchaeota archaeon]
MNQHDDELAKLGKELGQHEQSKQAGDKHSKHTIIGHHTNKGFYLIIAFLVIVIIVMAIIHLRTVERLERAQVRTMTETAFLQADLDHYKEAYEIALEDAKAFGKIHDIRYGEENNTADTIENVTALPTTKVWEEYQERGLIADECIPSSKLVQTPEDEVEIVVVAAGTEEKEWPRLALLIDGIALAEFHVESEEQTIYKTAIVLPKGTHHLDLVYNNADKAGPVTVSLLRIGDRTLETEISILDYGFAFSMFDCEDTAEGDTLKERGAMRFRIEKV